MSSDLVMSFRYALAAEIYQRGWFLFQHSLYGWIELKRFNDIWWCYVPEFDRWVIADSPFLATATVGYYNAAYHRIDNAIDEFRKKVYNPEDQSWLSKFECDTKDRWKREWELFMWRNNNMIFEHE